MVRQPLGLRPGQVVKWSDFFCNANGNDQNSKIITVVDENGLSFDYDHGLKS